MNKKDLLWLRIEDKQTDKQLYHSIKIEMGSRFRLSMKDEKMYGH